MNLSGSATPAGRLVRISFPNVKTAILTPDHWITPLADYLAGLRAGGQPESTRKLRSYHLRRFAVLSGALPFEVDPAPLIAHLGSAAWSTTTIASVRGSLRSFYGWAESSGRMTGNPALALRPIPAQLGRPRPASELAVRGALRLAGPRVRLMVMLAAQAGLRCREVAVVHSDDLRADLLGASLLIHGKGGKARTVPLNDSLGGMLLARPPGFAFPGQVDGHLSAHYVSKLISTVLPDGVTAHQLRHRFASVAYVADRDILAVQTLLGHASVATTQIYTAVPDGALRRAVANAA